MRVFLILFVVAAASAMSYEGYHHLRVGPIHDLEELKVVQSLETYVGERLVVFLGDEVQTKSKPMELVAHPSLIPNIRKLMEHHHIPMEIVETNIQKHMDDVMAENEIIKAQSIKDAQGRAPTPNYYMRHQEQINWLNQIAGEHSGIAATFQYPGQSDEGRNLVGLSINRGQAKPIVFFDAGIHAREWLAPATAIWLIHTLLTVPAAAAIRDRYQWFISPCINPDGYEFSHTDDRLWRKNRQVNSGSPCVGTDLNRNWDNNWGGEGASPNPCSDTYHGTRAFSAPETTSVSNFITSLGAGSGFAAYIGAHCYSQYWLVPWGGQQIKPPDYNQLFAAGQEAVDAIHSQHGGVIPPADRWIAGTPPDILYVATGGAFDWVKAQRGVKYSYSPELRPGPNAANGFVQPASEIQPSGNEIYEAMVALLNYIQSNP